MSRTKNENTPQSPPANRGDHNRLIRLVALFKFLKATLLIAVGLGAFGMLYPSISEHAQRWATSLSLSSDSPLVRQLVTLIVDPHPHRFEVVGLAAFFFATLFTIEGVGLWLDKHWAEYLTVISTLSLVPFELYELTRRITSTRCAALVINLIVVAYLIGRLYRQRPKE